MRGGLFFSIAAVAILLCSSAQDANTQNDWTPGWTAASTPGSHHITNSALGRISGLVTDGGDQSASYATVTIHGPGNPLVSITAGEDGGFELDNLSPGHYEVVAKIELRETRAEVEVSSGTNWVTLTLPRATDSSGSGHALVSAEQLAVPDKARRELQKAQNDLHKKKWIEAVGHLDKALALSPHYAEALLCRALLSLKRNAPELAKADAEKAVAYAPENGAAYIVLGSSYNRLKQWDDALRTLNRGLAITPIWPAHYELSRALLAKGDFPGALHEAEMASTMVPDDYGPLHALKGYAYLGLGDELAARQELEAYIKLEPAGEIAPQVRQRLDQLPATSSAPGEPISADAKH